MNKRHKQIAWVVSFILGWCLFGASGEAATVRFAGVPTDTFDVFDRFTVSIEVDLAGVSPQRLTGVYLQLSSTPSGVLRIVSLEEGAATAGTFKSSLGTNRILWADRTGRAGATHEVAKATFEVQPSITQALATLEINVLELRGDGFSNLGTPSESVDISLLFTAPTPLPEVTPTEIDETIDLAENPSDQDGSGTNVGSSGCGKIEAHEFASGSLTLFCILFVLFFGIRRYRTKKGLRSFIGFVPVALVGLWVVTAQARTVQVNNASALEQAFQNRYSAGDVIEILPGVYDLNSTIEITPEKNGTGALGIPIVLRGAGATPSDVVINGGGKAVIGLGNGLSYWVFENIHFQNGGTWVRSPARPDSDPHIFAGEEVSFGIVIRNSIFSGSLPGGSGSGLNKTAIYLNSISTISSFDEGHTIEDNIFDDIDQTDSTEGYAYINLDNARYSVVRGNEIRHRTRATAPRHFVELDLGGMNLLERNFMAGLLRGAAGSEGVVLRYQSPASMVRNNIIYIDAGPEVGSPSSDVPIAGIFVAQGSSGSRNLIHHNSLRIDKQGGVDNRVVAHVYANTGGNGARVTNNVFTGGDFAASGAWRNSACSSTSDRIDLDTNYLFNTVPTDELDGPDEWRCYIDWTNGVEDAPPTFPYTGGDPFLSSSYDLVGGTVARTNGASGVGRCSDLTGSVANCDGRMGSTGGSYPYGSSTTFSFCSAIPSANGPDTDLDRRLELEDVLNLLGSDPGLADELASYLTSFSRPDLNCF